MSIINFGFSGKRTNPKLPPGQSEVKGWPVLTYGATPHIDTASWTLTVDGEVNEPFTIGWKEFLALPKHIMQSDIHCVTRWSKLDMEWEGISIEKLVEKAGGLKTGARFIVASSEGEYTTNLPIKDVMRDQAMIAFMADGALLTDEHGGPARLFVPHLYFWKSAKWIRKITFVKEDHPGFWEVNGYHNYGDPWREQRYDTDV